MKHHTDDYQVVQARPKGASPLRKGIVVPAAAANRNWGPAHVACAVALGFVIYMGAMAAIVWGMSR